MLFHNATYQYVYKINKKLEGIVGFLLFVAYSYNNQLRMINEAEKR